MVCKQYDTHKSITIHVNNMTPTPQAFAPFNTGQTPTISCLYKAATPIPYNFSTLIDTLQYYVDKFLFPVWGISAKLQISDTILPNSWALVFLDTADVANALGYHDLTPEGFPLSKIFVKTTIEDKEEVSVTASHEVAEMLLDPAINMLAQGPRGVIYAYEIADPCEANTFQIDGIQVSDFVYPSWFEEFRKPKSTQFDQLSLIDRPFKILRGGYMSVFKQGRWSQIFAAKSDKKQFNPHTHPRSARRSKPTLRKSKKGS